MGGGDDVIMDLVTKMSDSYSKIKKENSEISARCVILENQNKVLKRQVEDLQEKLEMSYHEGKEKKRYKSESSDREEYGSRMVPAPVPAPVPSPMPPPVVHEPERDKYREVKHDEREYKVKEEYDDRDKYREAKHEEREYKYKEEYEDKYKGDKYGDREKYKEEKYDDRDKYREDKYDERDRYRDERERYRDDRYESSRYGREDRYREDKYRDDRRERRDRYKDD